MRIWIFVLGVILIVFSACEQKKQNNNQDGKQISSVDSVEYLSNLIDKDSTDFSLYRRRAKAYLERGQVDPAFRDVSLGIDLNPNDQGLFLMLGDLYFIIGQIDNCIESYKKASKLTPDNVTPYLKLGEIYLVIKNYKQALEYIDYAISQELNSSEAFFLKGITFLEMQDTTAALINLKIAGNLDTLNYPAFMQTAAILTAQRDTASLEYYHAALKAYPDDERALLLMGVTRQEQGEYGKALDIYQKLIELYPTNKYALFNSGYIQMVYIQNYEVAVELFQSAVAVDPTYVDAVFNLGRSYEAMGRYPEARAQYKQALALETNYPLAIDGLNRLDDLGITD